MRNPVDFLYPDGLRSREKLFTRDYLRILVMQFLVMSGFSIYLFLPRFIRLTGGDEFVIGLIMGAPAAASVLFRLPTGTLIDRYGRWKFMVWGLAVAILASALPMLARGPGGYLLAVRALNGVATALYFTSTITYVADKAPGSRRAEAMAIYGVAGFLAQAITPYFCEWVLILAPLEPVSIYHLLFAFSTLLSAAALAVGLGVKSDLSGAERRGRPDPWHRVLRNPTMLLLMIPSIAFGVGFAAVFNFITDFIQFERVGSSSSFFLAYSVTIVFIRVTTGRLMDVVDRRWGILFSTFMMAVGLFYASLATTAADLIVVGILTGTGHGYIFPSLSSLTYESSSPANRGTAMALYMLGFDASNMLLSPVLGKLAKTWDYFAMYRVASGVLALGLVVFWLGCCGRRKVLLGGYSERDERCTEPCSS